MKRWVLVGIHTALADIFPKELLMLMHNVILKLKITGGFLKLIPTENLMKNGILNCKSEEKT